MTEVVLDASAILAFLRREPGAETVRVHLRGGMLSTVNYSEVLAKSMALGIAIETTEGIMNTIEVELVPFSGDHALVAAALVPMTRAHGLSLADRACLAVAKVADLPVLTADRRWAEVPHGVEVRLIR